MKIRIFNIKFVKFFCEVIKKEKKVKVENYYDFMEENIKNYEVKSNLNNINNQDNLIDEKVLLNILKCPMTESDLELSEEGLRVGHITYPKRNGIYILLEDEAKFNF